MNMKKKVCAFALAGAVAVSALSLGFAAWHTDITAGGSASAQGSWDVAISSAALELSAGAEASNQVTSYDMVRTGVKSDSLIAATISASTWLNEGQDDLIGTQSDEAMSKYTNYYAVDTSKYDLSDINSLAEEQAEAILADDSTVTISDYLKMYYRYINPTTDYNTEKSNACATKVVDGLIQDTEALLQVMFPATWQNYTLCEIDGGGYSARWNYTIAAMTGTSQSVPADEDSMYVISEDGTSVDFADVNLSLPGSWANYTLTVTNNGTANANLADVQIALNSESDQLELAKPELADETLAPGESCTFNVVVKAADIESGDLNATGALSITLPYSQDTVETAPDAGHTHG